MQRYISEQYKNETFEKESKLIAFSSDNVTITIGDACQEGYVVTPLSEPCRVSGCFVCPPPPSFLVMCRIVNVEFEIHISCLNSYVNCKETELEYVIS